MQIFKTKKQREDERAAKRLEADKLKWRKPEVVGREYGALCSEAGDMQYRIKALESQLKGVNERLHLIQQEYEKSTQVHGMPPPPGSMSKEEFEKKTAPAEPVDEVKLAAAAELAQKDFNTEGQNEAQSVQ